MSSHERVFGEAKKFEKQQLLSYAHQALKELAPIYLGDEYEVFQDALNFEISDVEDEGAEPVPLTRYDSPTKPLALRIVPAIVMEYAENLQDEVGHEAEAADIAKILVGAGVARSIAGWRATKSELTNEEKRNAFKELLCQKSELWTACADLDDKHGTELHKAVERLGDAQMIRINILRFALGASLTHLCDSIQLQRSIVEHMQEELIEVEVHRQVNLDLFMSWLDAKSAFAMYDDTMPELELAFSFPMSPGEELTSFAAQ